MYLKHSLLFQLLSENSKVVDARNGLTQAMLRAFDVNKLVHLRSCEVILNHFLRRLLVLDYSFRDQWFLKQGSALTQTLT